jgi:hypothetical protein
LLANATVNSMRGLRTSIRVSHVPLRSASYAGPAYNGATSDDEKASYRSFAHLGGRTEPLSAAGRFLQGREPEPGSKIPSGSECLGWRRERHDRRRGDGADSWDHRQSASDGIIFGPTSNLCVQEHDVFVQRREGRDQNLEDRTRALRQAAVRILDSIVSA